MHFLLEHVCFAECISLLSMFASPNALLSPKECEKERSEMARQNLGECEKVKECKGKRNKNNENVRESMRAREWEQEKDRWKSRK